MNNTIFSKTFSFGTIIRTSNHHTDARSGASSNYLARMKVGEAKIVSDNSTLNLKANDIFFIPQSQSYQSYWSAGTIHNTFSFIYFPNPKNLVFTTQIIPNPPQRAYEIFDEIEKNNTTNIKNVSLLYELLDLLAPLMQTTQKNKAEKTVEDAEEFMSKHTSFSMEDVSKHCGVSQSVLYSVFKKIRGETPVTIKNKILTERAIELLSSTDLTVEVISDKLGFSSATYFRKIFTSITGKRPKDYRNYLGV